MSRRLLGGVAWLCMGAGGCGLRVTLLADTATNQGRPLQVLVRTVDEQTYRSEPYPVVAGKLTEPDASVLAALTVEPRAAYRRTLALRPPKDRPVALYFLFTQTTGSWKMLLQSPLPCSVTVPLGRSGVLSERVQERRPPSLGLPSSPPPLQLPSVPAAPPIPSLTPPRPPVPPELPPLPARPH